MQNLVEKNPQVETTFYVLEIKSNQTYSTSGNLVGLS